MDDSTPFIALIVAAAVGMVAVVVILRRESRVPTPQESPFAVSTEGMKRCPSCGTGNLVTDANCMTCGKRLPG
ncbi:MAG TPA: hypothetical protein VIB02_10990 [Candidatus Limnocylindrales bacterium]|jgi:hypothetical protein